MISNMTISIDVHDKILKHTVFVTLALLLKFQATNLLLDHSRFASGSRAPEDIALIPAAGTQDFDGTGPTNPPRKKINTKVTKRLSIELGKQKQQKYAMPV